MLKHHSSRRSRLHQGFLNERLQSAVSYDRIAGYFRSSLLEVAGEAVTGVSGKVRIVCNSDLDPEDLATATAAQAALRRSWCAGQPELAPPNALPRYKALYEALISDKIEIRVLPDTAFGLIHGKAGVIRYANGSSTAFLGSVNESASAWTLNYELLWESDEQDTIAWVQEEFDALWNDHRARALADCPFIQNDVQRIIRRRVVEPETLKTSSVMEAAAAAAVETPIYRREQGLWPHQKYFASLALERHRLGGARLVLADQVGLGKTVQLAMAALLMAMEDPQGGPILVLAPRPLLQQWRDELMELLQLPSAYWNGRGWVDENDVEHPSEGVKSLCKCPRRIGLVSQGLIVRGMSDAVRHQLLNQRYTCVIVDEAHRARRRKQPKADARQPEVDEQPDPNNLMALLCQIGDKTKSMLLATATPVQLHPVEAWDLLSILSNGNEGVLGGMTKTSPWFSAYRTIQIATGEQKVPAEDEWEGWEFVRDPLPAATEDSKIQQIRRQLQAHDGQWQFKPETLEKLPVAQRRVHLKNNLLPSYGERFNPLLRCIVRRTRSYLEQEINPATGSYYLPKVEVRLFGEDDDDAITLGVYLKEAYEEAEAFCDLLQQRMRGAGFFKTLLLRRLGSSMEAGRSTVAKLLGMSPEISDDEDEDDANEDLWGNEGQPQGHSQFRNFSTDEIASLERCLDLLEQGGNRDPKLEAILGYLLGANPNTNERWLDRGCILFSQYYDTVRWLGDELARHPDLPGDLTIGLYAGSNRSGFWLGGCFQRCGRTLLKDRVRKGEINLLLGTDAASEGLNLQRLGTLINIDLPWNPTRLEQRKGRIQRIGQARNSVWIANLRYRDSVEDKVHKVLAERLHAIHDLFGQIPDTLKDVWVKVALKDEAEIAELIDQTTATRNPFDRKYSKVEDAPWESCASVLNPVTARELMKQGWS